MKKNWKKLKHVGNNCKNTQIWLELVICLLVKSQCLMVQTLIKQQQQKIKVNTAAYVKYFELLTKNNWQIFSKCG